MLKLKLQYLNWLIGTDPDAGKDWRQKEKNEMIWWHHQLDGHESEQALGVGDGQGSLECCSPWVCKELYMTERLDMTEWLNWTEVLAKMWRKGNPCALLEECKLVQSLWKTAWSFLKKLKNRTTIWYSNPVYRIILRRNEITILKRYVHLHVHCIIIYNSQDMKSLYVHW